MLHCIQSKLAKLMSKNNAIQTGIDRKDYLLAHAGFIQLLQIISKYKRLSSYVSGQEKVRRNRSHNPAI